MGNEGIMIKKLCQNSQYEIGERRWYKLKYLDKNLQESLDLVVMGAYKGKVK